MVKGNLALTIEKMLQKKNVGNVKSWERGTYEFVGPISENQNIITKNHQPGFCFKKEWKNHC